MPLSISGTNCCGSLTNFFTASPLSGSLPRNLGGSRPLQLGLAPRLAHRFEQHRDADRACVHLVSAALAGVRSAAALGEHALRGLGALSRCYRRALERDARALVERRLEHVDRRDQRVEQRLVTEVGVSALLDALY